MMFSFWDLYVLKVLDEVSKMYFGSYMVVLLHGEIEAIISSKSCHFFGSDSTYKNKSYPQYYLHLHLAYILEWE